MLPAKKDFKVAIVGGGMCGLVCAVPLVRAGIDVVVFEQAAKFEEVGAGVGFGPNAIRILEALGVMDAVLAKSDQYTLRQRPLCFIEGIAGHNIVYDYANSYDKGDSVGLGIYRPAFLDALIPLLPPSVAQFNKRCAGIERTAPTKASQTSRYLVRFDDGSSYEADLVIGADGIKSVTRGYVLESQSDGVDLEFTSGSKFTGSNRLGFSNTYAYRGMVPIEKLREAGVTSLDGLTRPFCWVGYGKHVITFPIKGGTMLNIVAFVRTPSNPSSPTHDKSLSDAQPAPWVSSVPSQELMDAFSEWGPDAQIMLSMVKEPSRWSIHTLYPPLESYTSVSPTASEGGGVVLVGDAAHGMLPHLGAGVGQGFEDVYVLTRLLTHANTNKSNLQAALKLYDSLRPKRANFVLERSILMGHIYDNYTTDGTGYDADKIGQLLCGMYEPVWEHNLISEVDALLEGWRSEGTVGCA